MRARAYCFAIACACSTLAFAQSYPARPVRIVTAATGSANDWGSRVLAQELTAAMGQQVIVENRGGLSMEYVAKAVPDGHTILGYGSAAWLTQFLRDSVNWDIARDFIPVTLAMSSPNILVVRPSLPARTVQELIDLAKAKKDSFLKFVPSGVATVVNGGSVNSGSHTQTYNGPVTVGGLATQTTTFTGVGMTFGNTLDGTSRVVVADSGNTTYTGAIGSVAAPAHFETDAVGSSITAFGQYISSEIAKWGKVIKVAGIKGE